MKVSYTKHASSMSGVSMKNPRDQCLCSSMYQEQLIGKLVCKGGMIQDPHIFDLQKILNVINKVLILH